MSDTNLTDTQNLSDVPPWGQRPDEGAREFNFFYKYYLPLGFSRSVRKAYFLYLSEVEPTKVAAAQAEGKWIGVPGDWTDASRVYDWKGRAEMFDKEAMAEAIQAVEEAAKKIRMAAPLAADTLIENFKNPRNGVAAANSILDRAGVKTATIVISKEFKAEDMAKAEEELRQWQQTRDQNETPTSSG